VRLRPTATTRGRSAPRAAAVAAVALLLGACGGGDPAAAPAAGTTSTGGAAAAPADEPDDGPNPVIDDDFPDPDVLEVDDVYYAYATEGNLRNVRVARSTDLLEWEPLPDALPELPSWIIPGKTWAPEVTEIAPGQYVLYFTATNFRPTLQCVGVATATSPEGPFTVVGEGMLVCPEEEGGAIDASTFLDADGTRYLLWKNDGNCCGLDTWLQIAPLSADGLTLAGPTTKLVQQDQPWEGNLVEAPTLVERDGTYTLLYSANDYGGPAYAIGWATASSVLGPYTKGEEPLLTTAEVPEYVGPGGQDVVVGPDGEDQLVFHSWYGERTYRGINVLPLQWQDGVPVVEVG
jgi:arabinan endo-1,5-alpha-L-arabinosidase